MRRDVLFYTSRSFFQTEADSGARFKHFYSHYYTIMPAEKWMGHKCRYISQHLFAYGPALLSNPKHDDICLFHKHSRMKIITPSDHSIPDHAPTIHRIDHWPHYVFPLLRIKGGKIFSLFRKGKLQAWTAKCHFEQIHLPMSCSLHNDWLHFSIDLSNIKGMWRWRFIASFEIIPWSYTIISGAWIYGRFYIDDQLSRSADTRCRRFVPNCNLMATFKRLFTHHDVIMSSFLQTKRIRMWYPRGKSWMDSREFTTCCYVSISTRCSTWSSIPPIHFPWRRWLPAIWDPRLIILLCFLVVFFRAHPLCCFLPGREKGSTGDEYIVKKKTQIRSIPAMRASSTTDK